MSSIGAVQARSVGRSLRTPGAWGVVFGVVLAASPLAFSWLDAHRLGPVLAIFH